MLTPEQNKKLAEWKLKYHRLLLQRGRQYSGFEAHDVEEAVQRTWFKAVVYFATLTDQNVLPYLLAVLLNSIRDMANGQKRLVAMDGAVAEAVEVMAPPEEEPVPWDIPDQDLERAILALPPRVKESYVLRRQGLKHREIADRMGITVGCAGSLLSEAHKRLRKELRRSGV